MGSTVVEPSMTMFPAHAIWIPENNISATTDMIRMLFFRIFIFLLLFTKVEIHNNLIRRSKYSCLVKFILGKNYFSVKRLMRILVDKSFGFWT